MADRLFTDTKQEKKSLFVNILNDSFAISSVLCYFQKAHIGIEMEAKAEATSEVYREDTDTYEKPEGREGILLRPLTKSSETGTEKQNTTKMEDNSQSRSVTQKEHVLTYETPYGGANMPLCLTKASLGIEQDQNAVKTQVNPQPSSDAHKSNALTYEIPDGGDYMPLPPSKRSWEIRREHVEVIKIIGKGAFSEVAKATLWNTRDNQKCITVAAKMLKGRKYC